MAEKKQSERSVKQRAARNIAYQTAGMKPGFTTTLKRGVAMIGAMVAEAAAPSKGHSDLGIKQRYDAGEAKRGAAKKKKAASAEKKAAERRKHVEKKTGTSVLKERMDAVSELAKAGNK